MKNNVFSLSKYILGGGHINFPVLSENKYVSDNHLLTDEYVKLFDYLGTMYDKIDYKLKEKYFNFVEVTVKDALTLNVYVVNQSFEDDLTEAYLKQENRLSLDLSKALTSETSEDDLVDLSNLLNTFIEDKEQCDALVMYQVCLNSLFGISDGWVDSLVNKVLLASNKIPVYIIEGEDVPRGLIYSNYTLMYTESMDKKVEMILCISEQESKLKELVSENVSVGKVSLEKEHGKIILDKTNL